jgi:hypothetical protein
LSPPLSLLLVNCFLVTTTTTSRHHHPHFTLRSILNTSPLSIWCNLC